MSNPSNLYAEKLLSEHPLAIWSLDDNSDYVSLISESFRNLNTWTITNGTKSSISYSEQTPFPYSYITQITGSGSPGTTTIVSANTFTSDSDGFTVSFYIQALVDTTIKIGYTGITSQEKIVYGSKYPKSTWIPVSFTFSNQATSKNLKIELVYTSSSPIYYINGLTIGKNSEPFNGESFGQSLITLPASIATTQTKGIEAKSFGSQEYSAYYIGNGNDIYCKNFGMPLSFGSANSAIVYPHSTSGQPSFIFPGFGFLNNDGKYKELTLEMLIRINANNNIPKRIIGPLGSTDGVYVTKEFISLKINNNIKSFYLSQIYKPMLLQVKVGENYATLTIDGEDIISLSFDSSALSFPSLLDNSSKNQDWIGLFAYSDIKFIEVDSIAIYPYNCSSVLTKTRFAFAQALEVPNNINSKYGGSTVLADYGFANYTNNYNYPSFHAKWEQGSTIDNFDVILGQTLSTKKYNVPKVFTSLYDSNSFLKDLYATYIASGETNTFINLKPTTVVSGSGRSWSTNFGYLYTDSFNKSEHLSKCIYGVFKSIENSSEEQILFKILNRFTGDYLKVSLTNTTVSYILNYQDSLTTLSTTSITQNTMFAVGLDLQNLVQNNQNIATFLSDTNNLNIYVGGDSVTANTFSGNIYKIGLCSLRNFSNISGLFSSGILTDSSSYSALLSFVATYSINAVSSYASIILDIATNSYWQDYVPLSKLSKNITDISGNKIDDLDFIQINIDYPETRTYSSGNFDTSSSKLKSYITFQTLTSGSLQDVSTFTTTVLPNENRVIDASTFSSTTKYEFVNGMVVYPPKNIDFTTLAIVFHIELNAEAINLKPYDIRYLQVAARTLEYNFKNSFGTRYSVNMYPYIKSSSSYDYKSKNPYLIYKQSSPYLYLTKDSGFRVLGTYDSAIDRGIYIETGNSSLAGSINSMQMSISADIKEFPTNAMKIFEITGNLETTSFYVKAFNSSKTKGIIYTDSSANIPIYYLNGKVVSSPIIELDEWNVLGISFINPIDISNSLNKIKITSNILLDNISYYGINLVEANQKSSEKLWSEIDNGFWNSLNNWTYSELYNYYKIYQNDLKNIYQIYTGTNKILIDTSEDSSPKKLMFNGYEYVGYMDIEKNTIVLDIV